MPRKERKVDSGLRWGEGSVQERTTKGGEVRYVARWPEGVGIDKVWRGKTFATMDEAEDHLRSIVRRKRTGTFRPETRMTVEECVAEYLERRKPGWAPNTYATATVFVRRSIVPYLGSNRIVSLTGHDIQLWLDTLARSGRRSKSGKVVGGMSNAAISQARSLLNGALNDAARFGLIPHNPAVGTKAGGKRTEARPTWTADEAAIVIVALADRPLLHAFYAVALSTGMRQGEMRALHWREVDLAQGTIMVRPSMTRDEDFHEYIGETTKTRTNRQVRIDAEVIDLLQRHRKDQVARRLRHAQWHDTDLVFDRSDGRFIPQATLQRWHERVIKETQVPKVRLHDLRHTYASLQAAAGVSARAVMDTLGHRKLSMTIERYTHASEAMQRDAAGTIARQLFPALSDTTTPSEKPGETG